SVRPGYSVRWYGPKNQTTYQLNTPFDNPDETSDSEIEVIDPRHPLFGRRFLLVSRTSSPHGPGHAFVPYREGMLLCIPLACTTLAPSRPPVCTKLTCD